MKNEPGANMSNNMPKNGIKTNDKSKASEKNIRNIWTVTKNP